MILCRVVAGVASAGSLKITTVNIVAGAVLVKAEDSQRT